MRLIGIKKYKIFPMLYINYYFTFFYYQINLELIINIINGIKELSWKTKNLYYR